MTSSVTSHRLRRRHVARAATTAAIAILLVATACSTDDDAAPPSSSAAPTTSAPPTTAPPSTAAATTTTTTTTTTTVAPSTTSVASAARRAQLSDILAAHMAAGEFVGARIALRDADGTITEVTAGSTSVDPASGPVDTDVAWNVGSVTKTFVAVVVLQLAEEGRLDLDAEIDRFLPALPGADLITPRQLLQHTSGLAEYLDQPAVVADLQREWTPSDLIAVAEAAGRTGEPGGPHRYSNTNYIVLGEIIEQVTGMTWADAVRTRIAEPLGLAHTSVLTDQAPVGYQIIDGAFVDWTSGSDPSVGGAGGGIFSNGRDLLRFATALTDGSLLSPDSQAAMEAFVPGDDLSAFGIVHGYGLGLEQYTNETISVIGHMGTGEAQSAFVGYDAERDVAVAVMTNTAVPGPQAIMAIEALVAASQGG